MQRAQAVCVNLRKQPGNTLNPILSLYGNTAHKAINKPLHIQESFFEYYENLLIEMRIHNMLQ